MEEHTSATPTKSMTFPHSTSHQIITNLANSAREVMELTPSQRTGTLQACHACRIHELMRYRSHTVDTDGF